MTIRVVICNKALILIFTFFNDFELETIAQKLIRFLCRSDQYDFKKTTCTRLFVKTSPSEPMVINSLRLDRSGYEKVDFQDINERRSHLINLIKNSQKTRRISPVAEFRPKTKSSKKQKNPKLNFGLGDKAMKILNTIKQEKLHEDSAFYFPPGDERNKYVFPSKDYGRITGPNAKPSKTPYVQDVRATFKKLLAMIGITKHYSIDIHQII